MFSLNVFAILFSQMFCSLVSGSIRIKNLALNNCTNDNYPVTISQVSFVIDDMSRIVCSGVLESTVDLKSPIKANVVAEVKHFGIWIKLPCERNVGSCTYTDLCDFGYPQNETCPKVLYDNNVPCRCPIAKGIYTIKPVFPLSLWTSASAIYSGEYWAKVTVEDSSQLLSCNYVTFELYNGSEDKKYVYIIETNDILD